MPMSASSLRKNLGQKGDRIGDGTRSGEAFQPVQTFPYVADKVSNAELSLRGAICNFDGILRLLDNEG